MCFNGPSYPLHADVKIAQRSKCHLTGMTSLSLLYAARSLSIQTMALATVFYNEQPIHTVEHNDKVETILLQLLDKKATQFFKSGAVDHSERVAKLKQPRHKSQVGDERERERGKY
jgi:purine nucleoside phosphorylase